MFWQKIQIFYEHTYIYQIYIKIHTMSVCLSFILTFFPWTNLRAKYIYGILLTWWIYSDYLKVIRIEIKNKCLFLKKKKKKKKFFEIFFFFFKFPPLPLPKGERSLPEGGDSRVTEKSGTFNRKQAINVKKCKRFDELWFDKRICM